jgi:hypothetical protein
MPRENPSKIVPITDVESMIHVVRGQRVMLDSDLAVLYGVTTTRLNEQVLRNLDRFPNDFAFLLTGEEFKSLISQIAISNTGRGGRRKLPRVFTEHGVAMLSSVLRSPQAVAVNIEIVRAFVRMRRLFATPGDIIAQLQALTETVRLHDQQIKAIAEVLQKMVQPKPPEPPKRRIGFHPTEPPPAE